jgi:hypothetical protein
MGRVAGLKQLLRGIWGNAPWEPVAVVTRGPAGKTPPLLKPPIAFRIWTL